MTVPNPIPRRLLGALLAVGIGTLGSLARGETELVHEAFDYLEGGALAGGATGVGWANAWAESGEGGLDRSELIIGPGSFPVPTGEPASGGNHVDLNAPTGERFITRALRTVLGEEAAEREYTFSFLLDLGGGIGVDFAGVELGHSAGGPTVFLGKPAGAGPGSAGTIGIQVAGQPFASAGVAGAGQKFLRLRWIKNASGAESLNLSVLDPVGNPLGAASATLADATFDRVTLRAKRDLAAGSAIPAFDEIRAIWRTILEEATLTVASVNPASGVAVTVAPTSLDGNGGGTTPFNRRYSEGEVISLTAPASLPDRIFQRWQLDGVDHSTNRTTTVLLDSSQTLTAVFAPPLRILSFGSVNPGSAVAIGVSPVDQNGRGSGATPFVRRYVDGSSVVVTASAAAGGNLFQKWRRDGADHSYSPQASVVMNASLTLEAVYTVPRSESEVVVMAGVTTAGAQISWAARKDFRYVLEAAPDLRDFRPISGAFTGAVEGQVFEVADPEAGDFDARFYRLRITEP